MLKICVCEHFCRPRNFFPSFFIIKLMLSLLLFLSPPPSLCPLLYPFLLLFLSFSPLISKRPFTCWLMLKMVPYVFLLLLISDNYPGGFKKLHWKITSVSIHSICCSYLFLASNYLNFTTLLLFGVLGGFQFTCVF